MQTKASSAAWIGVDDTPQVRAAMSASTRMPALFLSSRCFITIPSLDYPAAGQFAGRTGSGGTASGDSTGSAGTASGESTGSALIAPGESTLSGRTALGERTGSAGTASGESTGSGLTASGSSTGSGMTDPS